MRVYVESLIMLPPKVRQRRHRFTPQYIRPPFGTFRAGPISITSPAASGRPSVSTSDMKGPIWRGGKIHDREHLAADELLELVIDRDLRGGFLDADLLAEIDREPEGGLARLREGLGLHDGADADVDLLEIRIDDAGRDGGRRPWTRSFLKSAHLRKSGTGARDDASDGGAFGFSHVGAFASRSSLSSQSQAAPRTPAESPWSGFRIGVLELAREHMGAHERRQVAIDLVDIAHAAAEHESVRVEHVGDHGKAARQASHIMLIGGLRLRIARAHRGHDLMRP